MDDEEVQERLKSKSGCSELYRVTSYRGVRKGPDGSMQDIRIDVYDGGAQAGSLRWHVEATDEQGRLATGNPEVDLEMAIVVTHWTDLDGAPY